MCLSKVSTTIVCVLSIESIKAFEAKNNFIFLSMLELIFFYSDEDGITLGQFHKKTLPLPSICEIF